MYRHELCHGDTPKGDWHLRFALPHMTSESRHFAFERDDALADAAVVGFRRLEPTVKTDSTLEWTC